MINSNNLIEKAEKLLLSEGYTCVLIGKEEIFTSRERGVKPLVRWVESKKDFRGFSAADKVIGKGAAFLYVLLGIKEIYASVISSPALEVLTDNGICVKYDRLTENIINRTGDGICPFEEAVKDFSAPDDAYPKIIQKMKELNITL